MAVRGWGGSVATAIGVAATAGAAQLGLGYGLGIIAWLPSADGTSEAAWVASLAWATWIAATSVVAGAVIADRLSVPAGAAREDPPASPLTNALWRLALAVAAAVGALVTVALVAVPARAAERADTFSPQTIAAGYAVIGVFVGLLAAIGAIAFRAVAANIAATAGWLWLLAVVAVIDGVASGRGLATAQLGVWQFAEGDGYWFRNMYLPGVALSLGSALIIGALAGYPAARRGDNRVGLAVSGAVGPVLVAASYFLAAPRLVGVRAEQLSAYLVAPYAVIAGLAGSVLISAIGYRAAGLPSRTADGTAADGTTDDDMMADGTTEDHRADGDAPPERDAPFTSAASGSGPEAGAAHRPGEEPRPAAEPARGQATVPGGKAAGGKAAGGRGKAGRISPPRGS